MAAIILAVMGSLSHTSRHDVSGAAVASTAHGHTTASRSPRTARSGPRPPERWSTLALAGRRPPASRAETALTATLTRTLHRAGPETGALVYDLSAHAELFGLRPSIGRPPASVEKLWTTTALMERLGPRARLQTTVLGAGSQHDGVWRGNLYLRGGGDPTFGDAQFNRVWNHGYGPSASQLVDQLRRRGIRRVTGRVYGDESLFDRRRGGLMTRYLVDVPDLGGQLSALTYDHGTTSRHDSPATFAARELVLTMRGSGMAATASTRAAPTPRRAHVLAVVNSPSLSVMARLMDIPSDDLFAELLTKQLGVRFGAGGTISDGARVVGQTITSTYGLHPRILDGSGLAREDRTSPVQIVALLSDLWGTTVGNEVSAALPTVGVDGTVRGIAVKTAAQGRCIAKTGTLDFVTNLAGYCTGRGHHEIAFGLFVDGPGNGAAIALESKMVAAVARY